MIAGELAAALEHAHGEGPDREPVVHRDVSPSNVLVSPAGEVKLTDFGIARALGGIHLTSTGVIKGKVPYLPPEYIERGKFDQRSDLFSLGVLLFELLTGERPFDGESDLDTVRRIVSGERTHLSDLAPHVPHSLGECVERLIAADPAARFESARAFLEALPAVPTHAARRELGLLVEARMRATRASGRISTRVPWAAVAAEAPEDDTGCARTLTAPDPKVPQATASRRRGAITTRTRKPVAKGHAMAARVERWRCAQRGSLWSHCSRICSKRSYDVAEAAPVAVSSAPDPTPAQQRVAAHVPVVVAPARPEATRHRHPPPPPARNACRKRARRAAAVSQPRPQSSASSCFRLGTSGSTASRWTCPGDAARCPLGIHEVGVGDGRPEQRRSVQSTAENMKA